MTRSLVARCFKDVTESDDKMKPKLKDPVRTAQ